MDSKELIMKMKTSGFKKLTGPPEDWLKSFTSMDWGFREKERLRKEWEKIRPGDIFIFHSMKPEHIQIEIETGIIGVGVVKETKIGIDEESVYEPKDLRPLRIVFSEMWWFGEYEKISKVKFPEKVRKGDLIYREIYYLLRNCITFSEMKKYGFSISTQGAIQNIAKDKQEKLIELIKPRLKTPILNPN
ncbi:hypothetical protein DFR86_04830 [Acidianus sulfidivorans JP7]|uniref:EVE domain-containing protein n=1 Tax=Acidianus sulfidivorans JP7 TaxID=619593 RepID=A0A2U9ILQ7_9CREN|nr:hypothetical protein [Acidianus sulfidivorans]AWR96951.1 hypothetical protein DFR86_04830 [Acidianus sulfidivorans JP7]